MDDMVKKATTDLTEEIIQLRAENMVLKSVINIADDDSKALHKEMTKLKKGKAFWIFATAGGVGLAIAGWRKYQAERAYKKMKAEECIMEDFESDFDEID